MDITDILRESFRLLLEEPKLFVPRIISTGISTIWILGFPGLYGGNLSSVTLFSIIFYLVSLPFLSLLGVFVSVMLAEMVGGQPVLRENFFRALKRWRVVCLFTAGILLSGIVLYIPTGLGIVHFALTGSLLYVGVGAGISLMLMFLFSFSIFFLPISITQNDNVRSILSNSFDASRQNSFEVSLITGISMVFLGITFLAQGRIQEISIIGFVFGRFLSVVTTTYLFVLSPNMYMSK